jgi:chromosome partitioning protein
VKKIVFFFTKGGTGKTTACFNYGWYLAEKLKKRILFLDFDPQMNLVKSFGNVPEKAYEMTLENMIIKGLKRESIVFSHFLIRINSHIDLLPCSNNISQVEEYLTEYLLQRTGDENRLYQARHRNVLIIRFLDEHINSRHYDYVLIDSPPNYSLLSTTALLYAKKLVIIVRPELYSLLDMNYLLKILDSLNDNFEVKIKIVGAIINGFEPRRALGRQISAEFEARFGRRITILKQKIPLAPQISMSITLERSPVFMAYPKSPAAVQALRTFAELDSLIKADFVAKTANGVI